MYIILYTVHVAVLIWKELVGDSFEAASII